MADTLAQHDPPRSRAELEALIERTRAEWGPKVERYNYLLDRRDRCDAELGRMRPAIERYENETFDHDWEYFRRLQLDGVLPSLPRVRAPADTNHKNDGDDDDLAEEDDDGRNGSDFEIGSKG